MNLADIGGTYLRVADPDWADPLETSYGKQTGGRWNAPDTHPTLYLNANRQTARAYVQHKHQGLPYGPEDIDPAQGPHLVEVSVPDGTAAELRTDAGLHAVGLPASYPLGDDGQPVPWSACWPIGARAFADQLDGIACRSATAGGTEELAWFAQPTRPSATALSRSEFPDWYWTTPST